jgi:tetratricopeptide (TPR) repeat protein
MLADAAVVGKIFWAGAIEQMGGRDPTDVQGALGELSRKQLIRPARSSSIEGEAEYSFWHILARDVAYARLPRASRASRHVAAARWIESKAPERVEDLADVLAYHYATALDLARAGRQTDQAEELEAPALRFLTLAGERALGLDTVAALANLERALALAPLGHPERPEALVRYGEAAEHAARHAEARETLEEAISAFRARGDLPATARAMLMLGRAVGLEGDSRTWTLPAEALALLEPLGPSPELVGPLIEVAVVEALQGRSEIAIQLTERALGLASKLGLPRPARALGFRGMARTDLGDPGGLQDYREAIALATEAGQGNEVALLHNNLAMALSAFDGPEAAREVLRAGIVYAKARGLATWVDGLTGSLSQALIDTGELEEALSLAAEVGHRAEATGGVFVLVTVRAAQAWIAALRGSADQVAGVLGWLESAARATEDPQMVVGGLGAAALARAALGQDEAAAELLRELETYPGVRDNQNYPIMLPTMVRTALGIGDLALAERLVAEVEPRYTYAEHTLSATHASLTEARGDLLVAADAYADAADRWRRFGVITEQAFALLGYGRCLLTLSRPTEAAAALLDAREIFERLAAAPTLDDIDSFLRQAIALSS